VDILGIAASHMDECDHGLSLAQIAELIRCLDSLGVEGTLLDCSVSFVLMACERVSKTRTGRLHLVTKEMPT